MCAKSSEFSSDSGGGELVGVEWSFPGQAVVGDEGAGEAELGEGRNDDGGPAVGLFWGVDRGGGRSVKKNSVSGCMLVC